IGVAGAEVEAFKALSAQVAGGVVDPLRLQLLLNPGRVPDPAQALGIAGPGPEGGATEQVEIRIDDVAGRRRQPLGHGLAEELAVEAADEAVATGEGRRGQGDGAQPGSAGWLHALGVVSGAAETLPPPKSARTCRPAPMTASRGSR